jgi:transcriptional regulator with PAS, ATPase and Fis domain/Flp pilus assembly protein TadD
MLLTVSGILPRKGDNVKKKEPDPAAKASNGLDPEKLRRECPGVFKQSRESCELCLERLGGAVAEASLQGELAREVDLLKLMASCTTELKKLPEATAHLTRLLEIAQTGFRLENLCLVYNNLGRIDLIHSDFPAAVEHFRQGLELSERDGNQEASAGICLNLSNAYGHLGQRDECKKHLQRAMEDFSKAGNVRSVYLVRGNLANFYFSQGELSKAMELKQECMDYYRETGDKAQLARELGSAAVYQYQMKNLDKAIEYALDALGIKEELNDVLGIANVWVNLGVFYKEFGDDDSALRYYLKALNVFEDYGDRHSISLCLNNISNIYLAAEDTAKALEYLLRAVACRQEAGEVAGITNFYFNIASIHGRDNGDLRKALEYYDLAIQTASQCKEELELCQARLQKAVVLAKLGTPEEALSLLNGTVENILSHSWEKLYPDLHKAEADVYEALSRYREACASLKKYAELVERQQNEDAKTRIAEMKEKYESEKKEREAEIYRLKNTELLEKNRLIEEQRNMLQETLDKLYQSEIRYDFVSEELTRNIGTTLIGSSQTIRSITKMIAMVAKSERTNVLITGETGTGKEIVARSIHRCSRRGKQHFYAVNCSAVPDNLFESQFFGHEKDAFTGANAAKVGWFEIASNSTLFLDEIGSLSFDQQAKLLRALEERSIVRVGSHREIPIDLRIISATNVNLSQKVEAEEFRRDLYHRLAIFVINIPPLREHKEDIPLLLKHFVCLATQAVNKKITRVDRDVIAFLSDYDFPGNVRELRNMVERAVLVADSSILRREHFLIPLEAKDIPSPAGIIPLDAMERDMIIKALQATGYNRTQAAKLLGVERKAVERKILKYGISIPAR